MNAAVTRETLQAYCQVWLETRASDMASLAETLTIVAGAPRYNWPLRRAWMRSHPSNDPAKIIEMAEEYYGES